MNTPLETRSAPASLKSKILNALPAATYQMDRLLSLVDIVVSSAYPTACVEVGPQPRMHVNPGFTAKHCPCDEQLLMLVLHELYHVILGHTRLFPRPTMAHNIAFDAYINALLCHQFKDEPRCLDFFRSVNGGPEFPMRLLRPPDGWPGRVALPPGAGAAEIKVMQGLYGKKPKGVTYKEILRLLKKHDRSGAPADLVLLGDHSGEGKSGDLDDKALKSELLKGVLREVVKKWPKEAKPLLGGLSGKQPGIGVKIESFLMPKAKNPRKEFLDALAKLLARAGALRSISPDLREWKRTIEPQDMTTVVPDIGDRLAPGREALWGERPILFTTSIRRPRARLIPREAVHVYLDVSGSMSAELPWLAAALDPLERRGAIKLYAFSTIVSKVPRGGLLKDAIMNTWGTDINCVLEHVDKLDARSFPRKVLMLTDGYVGHPDDKLASSWKRKKIALFVGLVGQSCAKFLDDHARYICRMPELAVQSQG